MTQRHCQGVHTQLRHPKAQQQGHRQVQMQSHCLVFLAPPQAELHWQKYSSTANTPTGEGSLRGPEHSGFQEAPVGEQTEGCRGRA